jgi:protein transport protein SEC24
MQGRRLDIDQRPELLYGSVDWIATPEYCSRPPMPVSYLFCIDVGATSIANGMLNHLVKCAKDVISYLAVGTRVGIMTFDSSVHFYNLTAGLEQAQMMIVSDVEEVFCPLHHGLFVDPIASK